MIKLHDVWRLLRAKLLRRDILKVIWNLFVILPLRRTAFNKLFEAHARVKQDTEYLRLERFHYQRSPDVFASPGWKDRSAQLLRQGWPGPSNIKKERKEVRLLIIDKSAAFGPCFGPELERAFDSVTFKLVRHRVGYENGKKDLVTFGKGLNLDFHDVVSTRFRKPFMEWRDRLQVDLFKLAETAHSEKPIDLCFAYGSYQQFEPGTLRAIRQLGIPVALFWLDEKHAYWERRKMEIPNGQKPLIGSCDVHLTNSFECIRWYMSEGAAAFYFPQAVDSQIYKPSGDKRDIPVSFIGQKYGMRAKFIEALRKLGIEIQCFGSGWENGLAKDSVEIYLRSRINLGLGETGKSDRMTCIKGRDFEIPGTGSLYLTSYDPELAWLFNIGKEILCYRNEMDCAQQIRYYLSNTEHADAIASAGRARCLKQHTWTLRFESLLRWMGILEGCQNRGVN